MNPGNAPQTETDREAKHLNDALMAEKALNAARAIPLEVVEAKGHGHAGTAMALAPVAQTLFQRIMRHNPADPHWEGRDRFILSAGHASLLLYTQLYLTGYDLELEEIAKARSFGSRTPGHPEIEHTPGVEMNTGPLGQGVASAVGLAAALKHKQAILAQNGTTGSNDLFNQTVWVIAGDGCLQEGVSSEACSLAATWKLDNLVLIWDDNEITIDGNSALSFSEDTRARYRAYGWEVLEIDHPNDLDLVAQVLSQAQEMSKPVLVAVRTQIGYPAPTRTGTSAAHAGAFGSEETGKTKEALGYSAESTLVALVNKEVLGYTRRAIKQGQEMQAQWEKKLKQCLDESAQFAQTYADIHAKVKHRQNSLEILRSWDSQSLAQGLPTRTFSGQILNKIAQAAYLWGGSADLSGSTSVAIPGTPFSSQNPLGNQLAFGIREHAMAAILTGIALEGTWRPYGSTYLAFSDYARPALRLSAMMKLPVIHIYTHDSVAVGEDGPTHQPIEQISGLRSVPGVSTVRPADGAETVGAWKKIIEDTECGPTALILSRQNLPALRNPKSVENTRKGAYVLWQTGSGTDLALLASGSEVHVALDAAKELAHEGTQVRVVSVPCMEWFEKQTAEYQQMILPPEVRARVAIEAGRSGLWWKYVGLDGAVIGIDEFGVSGPGDVVLDHLGISRNNLVRQAREVMARELAQ